MRSGLGSPATIACRRSQGKLSAKNLRADSFNRLASSPKPKLSGCVMFSSSLRLGQAEHALAQNIALHFAGPGRDSHAIGIHIGQGPLATGGGVIVPQVQ